MHTIITDIYTGPCGPMILGVYDGQLCLCDWMQADLTIRPVVRHRLNRLLKATFVPGESPVLTQAAMQLDEYFRGRRTRFSLPLLAVGTEFQQQVWNQLINITYGHLNTYLDVGRELNMPRAMRAIGNAIGGNAMSIFIPCHRVVTSKGDIGGYAGGPETKRYLLELEGALKPIINDDN